MVMTSCITIGLNLFMAILFFLPFSLKIRNIDSLKAEIYAYEVLPKGLLFPAVFLVLTAEGLLFLLFSTGLMHGWKEGLGIGLLMVFTILTWRKNKRTGKQTCACYGNIGFFNRYPVQRNLIMIALLVISTLMAGVTFNGLVIINSLFFVMIVSFTIEILYTIRKRRRDGHVDTSHSQ
jgi:hypothetical protein